jgi:hypothetical protein
VAWALRGGLTGGEPATGARQPNAIARLRSDSSTSMMPTTPISGRAGSLRVTQAASGAASTPGDKSGDDRPELQAKRREEGEGDRRRHEELRGVGGADGEPRHIALADQRRCNQRPPPSAARSIQEAARQTERDDVPRRRSGRRLRKAEAAPEQPRRRQARLRRGTFVRIDSPSSL